MNLLDEIKILCIKNRISLIKMTELYNRTYGTKLSQQSMYRKLQTETIKYTEMVNLLRVLNCEIEWREGVINE